MATEDLTQRDMSDLDEELLRHLVSVGEHLHVERKRQLPEAEPLSELLGSLGNTEGGWAVLGVEDSGGIVGLAPSRADLLDEVRDRVQGKLDPLPNFTARRVLFEGVELGIIRVYPSGETPLVCTHKGAILIRVPGGKRPINSRSELDALIERGSDGREADAEAAERLRTAQVAPVALEAPELTGAPVYEEPMRREWILRVAPRHLPLDFAARVRTKALLETAKRAALALLPNLQDGFSADEWADDLPAKPSGWKVEAGRMSERASAAIVVDPIGVFTIVYRERGVRSVINVEPLINETLVPLLTQGVALVGAAGATGHLVCDLHARGFHGVVLQAHPHGHVLMPVGTRHSKAHGFLDIGPAGDLRAVASRLAGDIASDAGLNVFT